MVFFLYRFHPGASRVADSDFVAIEIAPHFDDAIIELRQDVLGDLYSQYKMEPGGIEISLPADYTEGRIPDMKYLMQAVKREPQVTIIHYYGISEVPCCQLLREG